MGRSLTSRLILAWLTFTEYSIVLPLTIWHAADSEAQYPPASRRGTPDAMIFSYYFSFIPGRQT